MTKRKRRAAENETSPSAEVPSAAAVDTHPAAESDSIAGPETRFPIVGIGASAGGLAAFGAFFSAIPGETTTGMAFVLVQHLAPDHKSILSDLIKRYTRMKVCEVEDGMKVTPDCAYIIPPNRDMAILNGVLQLLEPAAPHGQRLPIDFFFRSLAQDQRERAICVVLSGTGSDGTLGVRAVKGEGGMVMAQSPESTEYDGMPRSAIATGLVDYVLTPAEMPSQLMGYAAHAFGKPPGLPAPPREPKAEDGQKKILILLRTQTGHDFSQYKPNTIYRRVERRMAVHQIERLGEYIRYLQQNPAEVGALFQDLLIGVTSFFRDPKVWAVLQERIIPGLFADKAPGEPIRIWVPACSTGEEAYSIAMMVQEQIEALKLACKVQLFATDIDRNAIEQARSGIYPASIAADVSPERLSRFFVQEPDGGTCRINRVTRDMLVFSEQDVIKDPPFSKLDLISCRNLLIYMEGNLQKRLISLFHYALNPTGVLFLGTSETVGEFESLFAVVDRKSRLYRRKQAAHGAYRPAVGKLLPATTAGEAVPAPAWTPPAQGKLSLRELAERELLQQYDPVGALVNERGDILYIHGRTGQYLEPAAGEASMNILKMAREGLRRELTMALHKAATTKEPICSRGLKVRANGNSSTVDLIVRPVTAGPAPAADPNLFLIVFEEPPAAAMGSYETAEAQKSTQIPADPDASVDERIAVLTRELRAKEEYLQATTEELETSNEELKSSNEEMQSVNEELQSTNEELETSKEELQSVNEELATVNSELQQKVADLSRANNDMNNLLAGTGVGTVFVDLALNIKRFTPAAIQLINLIQSDVGRPVGHLASNLVGYDRLVEDVRAVLDSLVPREIEVQSKAGDWYAMRIRPYRTLENVIEGGVITFVDITEQKRIQESLRESETLRRLAAIVRDASDAVTMQDLEGRILAWNPGAVRIYGWSEAEALSMNIRDMIPEDSRDNALSLMRRLTQGEKLEPLRAQRLAKGGKIVEVWLTISSLVNTSGHPYAISTTERQVKKP
jgi:two-component system, chemotaxis family, CheB/CheR fusion protein